MLRFASPRRSAGGTWPLYDWRHWQARLWPATLRSRVGLSAGLHLLAVFCVLNAWWLGAPRLKPAGTSAGRHVTVTYNPGKPVPVPPQARRAVVTRHYPRAALAAPAEEATAKTAVQGSDALGSGTVSLLYVQAFPRQKPDLSKAGATGDVVVDVEIDDTGHVAQVHARHGMGAQIDDMVVATVERWVFYPAVRDGRAVRSERELRFHFDRRSDANCGWECFALEEQ